MIKIDLPYPISANRYWRYYRGHVVVSEEAKTYRRVVGLICNHTATEPLSGEISVEIEIRRPAKRRDIDNHIKILLDSLQGHAYHNDNQIMDLHLSMRDDKQNPGVTVVIGPI